MDENKIAEEAASSPERKKPSLMANLYDWFEVLCVAAVIVVLIFTFVGRMATVNGSSMSDTLLSGDRLIVTNLFYTPQRYDIVVVQKKDGYYSDELLVKRIIATGGETITFDFDNWTVTVDGVGDNRNGSTDSRSDLVGFVKESEIVGHAVFRLFPLNAIGTLD